MEALFRLLRRLDEASIFYTLAHVRGNAVMICISVPGERWEVELLDDATVEVEVFRSDGAVFGDEKIEQLFSEFSG